MDPLISMQARPIGGIQQQTVNARELWKFVESKQQFADWIKNRITEYGFSEGEDYLIHKFMKQVPHQGGFRLNEQIDYYLTVDMSKELAMVERNAKGREVRRYFIECERLAKAAHAERLAVSADTFMSKRMQRFTQKRGMARLDRYQSRAVNQKAAAMGRQIGDICREYLAWELAGTPTHSREGQVSAVDDNDLYAVLHYASVEDVMAYAYARENAQRLAHFKALRDNS